MGMIIEQTGLWRAILDLLRVVLAGVIISPSLGGKLNLDRLRLAFRDISG